MVDPRPSLAIAITGGIGSGKSRVARWLAAECALPLFDADAEARVLLEPEALGWQRLRGWLPEFFFGPAGVIVRPRLRQAIFEDAGLRRRLEADVHPLVLAALQRRIALCPGRCLVEVPLLFEVNWQGHFDRVLVVYAPDNVCCQRIMARDGVPAAAAAAALRAQMPLQAKMAQADDVVDNGGKWEDTVPQLLRIRAHWASLAQDPACAKVTWRA